MDLLQPRDEYCERVSAAFLAEPLNLVTNLSFIIASYLLWKRFSEEDHESWPRTGVIYYHLLILNVLIIGLGSAAYHSFANNWSHMADVIPISFYLSAVLFFIIRYSLGFSPLVAALGLVVFAGITALFTTQIPSELVNGSNGYFGAFVTLLGIGLYVRRTSGVASARWFIMAAILFAISLILRSVDAAICDTIPIGTHFFWHLFNGTVLFCVMTGARETVGRVRPAS